MKNKGFVLTLLAVAGLFSGCKSESPAVPANKPMAAATTTSTPAAADSAVKPADAATMTPANTLSDTNFLSSAKGRESYALGMYFGTGWKRNDVDVDPDLVLRGIKDAEGNGQTLMSQQQMMAALNDLRQSVQQNRQKAQMQMQAEMQKEGAQNQKEGEAFLAENKTRPGVVAQPDGLEYKIIKDGEGASPGPNDIVRVNYRGTLVNGTEFDSSAPGRPAEFRVNGVIPGWTEALEKMKAGSVWDIYIPSSLAYGPPGRAPKIGPDETLIFRVELLSFTAGPQPPHVQPLTSDIIKVPSAEEMKKGAKIETIKASDLQKMQQSSTNQ